MPEESFLGPLVFNIYLNDLVFLADSSEVCNFADTRFFALEKDVRSLINRLEHDSVLAVF